MTERGPQIIGGSTELEPIPPREAYDWYLDDRAPELSESTMYAHTSRLGHFVRWCEAEAEIDNLNALTGRSLQRFKTWRRDEGDLNLVSVRTQLSTLRVFIRWCEGINAVTPGLHEFVQPPKLTGKDGVDDRMIPFEQANAILTHLAKYEYASFNHALFEVLWVSGMRMGGAHSLDVSDYAPGDGKLKLRHRPDTGTTLKNGEEGDRNVSLRAKTCQMLDDYLAHRRVQVQDEYGREPLFSTAHGRASKSHLRVCIYSVSQPCRYGEPCPVGKEPETCEHREKDRVSSCPENTHPHGIRKGAITWALNNQAPIDAVSDRMNVSMDVLKRHYDHATEDERMNRRREFFDAL